VVGPALLPAATATAAVLRGRERPPAAFWIVTAVGALAAIVFAFAQSGGFGQSHLAVVSMFLGFFAWYRGLAIGPMARVSQIQLNQPVLSICWAGFLLGETVTWTTLIGGLAVILCAGIAVRVRFNPPDSPAATR
jgi:drug/metabolite transporter (DMT)-like permease